MKKTILTATILSVLMIGCKGNKTKNNDTSKTTKESQNHKEEVTNKSKDETAVYNNAWLSEIELDNGDKWQANVETNEGVEKMLELVENSEPKTVEDYQNLASKLNETKNFIVKKCTMKGPSHDNLHVFLHPLIKKIASLGKVSSTKEGAKITTHINENLKGYYDYFK